MISIKKYLINKDCTICDALYKLNELSSDVMTLFIVDENFIVLGTLTDGDIRRKLITGSSLEDKVSTAMNKNYSFMYKSSLDLLQIKNLRKKNIQLLPLIDREKHILDILNLKTNKSFLPVEAVLMAGGKGERLRPLTENTPKPLLQIGNKAIIDHNVDKLIEFGVTKITVTVNYLKQQIIEHFKSYEDKACICCVSEPQFLGTMGSLKLIDDPSSDFILIMNSDLFTNINYEDFFLHFIDNDADMSVAAIPYSIAVPYGIFELEGRNIRGVKEKPTYNYYANAGIYLLKKKFIGLIPENEMFDATDMINLLIDNNYKVIRYPITGYWIDIGKHEDYKKAQELIKHL